MKILKQATCVLCALGIIVAGAGLASAASAKKEEAKNKDGVVISSFQYPIRPGLTKRTNNKTGKQSISDQASAGSLTSYKANSKKSDGGNNGIGTTKQ
jgi:hypothetical protein